MPGGLIRLGRECLNELVDSEKVGRSEHSLLTNVYSLFLSLRLDCVPIYSLNTVTEGETGKIHRNEKKKEVSRVSAGGRGFRRQRKGGSVNDRSFHMLTLSYGIWG